MAAAAAALPLVPSSSSVLDAALAQAGLHVSIDEWEKRETPEGEFIAYCVALTAEEDNAAKIPPGEWLVYRRYNDFDHFRNYLFYFHGEIIIPPLPQKKMNFKLSKMAADKFDPEFVLKRSFLLQSFVKRVLTHATLRVEPCVAAFFTSETWKTTLLDRAQQPWEPGLVDTMKNFASSVRAKAPDSRFLALKFLAEALTESLGALIAAHGRYSPRMEELFASFNVQAKLLRSLDFNDGAPPPWMGDVAEKLSQLPAPLYDMMISERDSFVSVLEEYLEYAESLKAMVRRQQQSQMELEDSQAALAAKQQSLTELRNPGTQKGFRSLFSGLVSTSEAERAAKEEALEAQIQQLTTECETRGHAHQAFVDAALQDAELFKAQKSKDLHASVLALARLQKAQCVQALGAWKEAREQLGVLPPV